MRAHLAAAAVLFAALSVTACEAAEDARSGVEEAASSAASIGAGARDAASSAASIGADAREACRASADELTQLGDLADRLSAEPDLSPELAPQVKQTVDKLAAEVGSRPELQPVVVATRELASAVGEANRDTVEVAARQAAAAIRSTQAGCRLVG